MSYIREAIMELLPGIIGSIIAVFVILILCHFARAQEEILVAPDCTQGIEWKPNPANEILSGTLTYEVIVCPVELDRTIAQNWTASRETEQLSQTFTMLCIHTW